MSSAVVTFGLVNIPVKLYSTGESSSSISFNLIHERCGGRVKQQYICPKEDGITVSRDEMVKGYEFAKDQYVLFSETELKAIEDAASKAIEIVEFVPEEKVDPLYYDRAYYLGPDKGADRAYRLLGEAMRQTGLCAIARFTQRGRESIVLMRPMDKGLVLTQLKYADEVRKLDEVPIGEAEVKEAELNLAKQFVNQLATGEFSPEKYEDAFRKRLQEIIDRKVQGEQVTMAPAEEPRAQVIDLMEALKASLARQPAVPAKAAASSSAEAEEGKAEAAARKPPKRAAAAKEAAPKAKKKNG